MNPETGREHVRESDRALTSLRTSPIFLIQSVLVFLDHQWRVVVPPGAASFRMRLGRKMGTLADTPGKMVVWWSSTGLGQLWAIHWTGGSRKTWEGQLSGEPGKWCSVSLGPGILSRAARWTTWEINPSWPLTPIIKLIYLKFSIWQVLSFS